jgi:hypothetical protein
LHPYTNSPDHLRWKATNLALQLVCFELHATAAVIWRSKVVRLAGKLYTTSTSRRRATVHSPTTTTANTRAQRRRLSLTMVCPVCFHWLSDVQSDVIPVYLGVSWLRGGWGDEKDPRVVCENVVSRYRDRRAQKPVLLAGSAASLDHNSRISSKTPYEGDIIVNFDSVVRTSHSGIAK